MGRIIVGTTMSLDGFINDHNSDVTLLYPDLVELLKTEFLQESMRDTGAVVMGRRAYDMAQGDLTGYEYQVPIFVLTHNIPEQAPKGQNGHLTITFVTDGIESAIEKAKAASGEKDITVVGGASTAQQCIKAGLIDELHIGLVPILLGDGLRFFEHLEEEQLDLERIDTQESHNRTGIKFRVVKKSKSK